MALRFRRLRYAIIQTIRFNFRQKFHRVGPLLNSPCCCSRCQLAICAGSVSSSVKDDFWQSENKSYQSRSCRSSAFNATSEPKLKHWNHSSHAQNRLYAGVLYGFPRNRSAHVFQHAALLADLQFAVTVGTLKSWCMLNNSSPTLASSKLIFPKAPARRPGSVLDKFYPVCLALGRIQELQGKIQHHHRWFSMAISRISPSMTSTGVGAYRRQYDDGSVQSSPGSCRWQNFAIIMMNVATHRERRRAQRQPRS